MITNLEEKLNPRGIVINQLDITDFDFSDEFNRAIEAKVTAEQDALKSKALVEKVKYEAESKIAKAEGDAKAVEIAAIAEAEAIRIKAKAIQVQ
jgi:regulator of protease activity HflC (stomatin/prohibitin superfamily)